MSDSKHLPMEEMRVFKRFEDVADWAWEAVQTWDYVAKKTVGVQLIRAADSVGANLVEGDGRYTDPDGTRFFLIARGSAREARLWLKRAAKRGLITRVEESELVERLTLAIRELNNLIKYRRSMGNGKVVREAVAGYGDDPFVEEDCGPSPNTYCDR